MKKIFFCFLTAGALLQASAFAQEKPVTELAVSPAGPANPASLRDQAIRDQVRLLREERIRAMPYLDKGFIRTEINAEKIRNKSQFVAAGTKTLDDLIGRAIQVHTPARAAHERIALAQRRILAAMRQLFPQVAMELQKKDGELSASPFNSRDYKFTFRQPIFRGGILWNSLLKEKAGLEAAQKEYDKVIHDVIYDVCVAYFEYNRSEEVIKDQVVAIEKMRRFVEISEQKYKEEIASELEHLNVQSLFSQMQYDYETAKQEFELGKLDLQKYLDLTLEDDLEVANLYNVGALVQKAKDEPDSSQNIEQYPDPLNPSITMPDLPQLVDMAYIGRPELQVEAAKLQSARLEHRIRMGQFIPHADVLLEFGKLGEAFTQDATRPGLRPEFQFLIEMNWNAAGNKVNYTFENSEQPPSVSQFLQGTGSQVSSNKFTVGLLDGLEELAELKEAEVAKLDQIIELEKAEKEVVQDVKQAYFDYQKARIQVASSLKRVDYRRRLALLAEHRLGQNEIQISEYMQSEIDLVREKTELHKALKDYFTAKAQLNRAVGKRDFLPLEAKV